MIVFFFQDNTQMLHPKQRASGSGVAQEPRVATRRRGRRANATTGAAQEGNGGTGAAQDGTAPRTRRQGKQPQVTQESQATQPVQVHHTVQGPPILTQCSQTASSITRNAPRVASGSQQSGRPDKKQKLVLG